MSDQKVIQVNAIPSCIDESASALVKPSATELGEIFSDLLFLIAGDIHLAAAKKRSKHQVALEQFQKDLKNTIAAKPSNVLVKPRTQVVGQALREALLCVEEPQLREMFQNLIANASDERFQSKVHPSFPAIIAQMSPLDAENLVLFTKQESFPVACYCRHASIGQWALYTDLFLSNPNMVTIEALDLQSASLGSLKRQGLISITYDQHLVDESLYDMFKQHELFKQLCKELDSLKSKYPSGKYPNGLDVPNRITIRSGIARLTPFGENLADVCFRT